MLFRWCILSFMLVAAGCGPTTLDVHTLDARAVRDLVLTYDQTTRLACPSADTSTACAEAYDAQHAFVDAYTNWLIRLRHEAHVDHWRNPQDAAELDATCAALARYRAARSALDLHDADLPTALRGLCGGAP